MAIEVVRTTEQLVGLAKEWEVLEAGDPHASFYASHRFVTAWWLAYEDDDAYALHTLAVRHNGDLVGVAPLVIQRRMIRGVQTRVLRWASHGDYLGLLLLPQFSDRCSQELLAAMRQPGHYDRVSLSNMRPEGSFAHYILRSDDNAHFRPHIECPYVDLRLYSGFPDFCARAVPAHTRKYRNKFLRERDAQFKVYRGNESDILGRIGAVHMAERDFLQESFGRSERHSLFDNPRRLAHMSAVYERQADTITFAFEDASNSILAYRTCFIQGRTLLSWNSAYAPTVHSYRMGKVVQYDIMSYLFASGGVDLFDFGAGRYPWKFEWTDQFNATYWYRYPIEKPAKASIAPPKQAVSPTKGKTSGALAVPSAAHREKAERVEVYVAPQGGIVRARRAAAALRNAARARRHAPVIWYVPHPDDESIFMGGSIAARPDRRHLLVLLTHGGASKALLKVNARLLQPLSREDFMAARVREFSAAVRPLGIHKRDIVHGALPDGAVTESDVLALITTMAARYPEAEHRTMSYLDPHSDHAAAGKALRQAYRQGVVTQCVFHLPVPFGRCAAGNENANKPARSVSQTASA